MQGAKQQVSDQYAIPLVLEADSITHVGRLERDKLGATRWACSCGRHGLFMRRNFYRFAYLWRVHVYSDEHWVTNKGKIPVYEHKNWVEKEVEARNGLQ